MLCYKGIFYILENLIHQMDLARNYPFNNFPFSFIFDKREMFNIILGYAWFDVKCQIIYINMRQKSMYKMQHVNFFKIRVHLQAVDVHTFSLTSFHI